jgi:hypothetical protein
VAEGADEVEPVQVLRPLGVGAGRELEQALLLLRREESSRLLLFGGGFPREGLIAMCEAELAASRARS